MELRLIKSIGFVERTLPRRHFGEREAYLPADFVLIDEMSCFALTTLQFCLGLALSATVSLVLVNMRRVERRDAKV